MGENGTHTARCFDYANKGGEMYNLTYFVPFVPFVTAAAVLFIVGPCIVVPFIGPLSICIHTYTHKTDGISSTKRKGFLFYFQ